MVVNLQGNKYLETQNGRRSVSEHKVMGKRTEIGSTADTGCPAASSWAPFLHMSCRVLSVMVLGVF